MQGASWGRQYGLKHNGREFFGTVAGVPIRVTLIEKQRPNQKPDQPILLDLSVLARAEVPVKLPDNFAIEVAGTNAPPRSTIYLIGDSHFEERYRVTAMTAEDVEKMIGLQGVRNTWFSCAEAIRTLELRDNAVVASVQVTQRMGDDPGEALNKAYHAAYRAAVLMRGVASGEIRCPPGAQRPRTTVAAPPTAAQVVEGD